MINYSKKKLIFFWLVFMIFSDYLYWYFLIIFFKQSRLKNDELPLKEDLNSLNNFENKDGEESEGDAEDIESTKEDIEDIGEDTEENNSNNESP